jgi:hypothetical protein
MKREEVSKEVGVTQVIDFGVTRTGAQKKRTHGKSTLHRHLLVFAIVSRTRIVRAFDAHGVDMHELFFGETPNHRFHDKKTP